MDKPSDWTTMVTELRASGLTLAQIAERTGGCLTALSDIGIGRSKEPRGWVAVKLYELHKRRRKQIARAKAQAKAAA